MWLVSAKCVGEYDKMSGQQSSCAMIMNWSTIPISKSGYAINITKFQEYPNKLCGSYVKCAEDTKE